MNHILSLATDVPSVKKSISSALDSRPADVGKKNNWKLNGKKHPTNKIVESESQKNELPKFYFFYWVDSYINHFTNSNNMKLTDTRYSVLYTQNNTTTKGGLYE